MCHGLCNFCGKNFRLFQLIYIIIFIFFKNTQMNLTSPCIPWYFPKNDSSNSRLCDPWEARTFRNKMDAVPDDQCNYCLPDWLAPNAMTLLGLLFPLICLGTIVTMDPSFTQTLPCWVWLLSWFADFWYQTIDAIDGK